MSIERNVFSTRDRLAQALADAVVDNLNAGLDERGAAALAVSGGSTPKQFFQTLAARQDVDWENVTITLVDDVGHTSVYNAFAAGDITAGPQLAIRAAADGAVTALAIHKSLLPDERRMPPREPAAETAAEGAAATSAA